MDDRDADTDSHGGDSEFASRVIDQVYDLFIFPELRGRGLPVDRASVSKALVTLAPGTGIRVDLNEEADLAFRAETTRAIDAGQPITTADIDPATVVGLRPVTVDPDAGWVALADIPGLGVVVAFDYTRNRGKARRLLDKAAAFHDAAEVALTAGLVSPSLDLAYSATELAVTAMRSLLLLEPSRGRRNPHGRRTAWFSQWTKLGNSPREFHHLFARLAGLRPKARYDDVDPLTAEETRPLLADVRDLIDHARQRVGQPLPDLPPLRG